MSKSKFIRIVEMNRKAIRQSSQKGLPMGLRLFLFLTLFLSSIMLGLLLILFATGIFKTGLLVHKPVLEGELNHIAEDISKYYGSLSVQAVELSKELSLSMERNIKEHGGSIANLQEYPELLEHLLEVELGRLIGALEKSRASGVFILLDATVNPELPGAENSRSCIYLKNMEPNIVNEMAANLRYYSGPMPIARNNGIHVLPQWQMEMEISEFSNFAEVMATAREHKLPLSRLYRWSGGTTLPGNSERVMLCMVPLITSDGTVFAICGFDVSEMLLNFPILQSLKTMIVCSACFHRCMKTGCSRPVPFAGSFAAGPAAMSELTEIESSSFAGDFYSYLQPEKGEYAGLHRIVSLYPSDSAYADEQWAVVLMMPRQGLNELISAKNRFLALGLLILLFFNIGLALLISHTYVRPVATALEYLKEPTQAAKTRIPEIDDLIEFLAAQDESSVPLEKELSSQEYPSMCREFIKNIQTLSPAEKAVFDLYVQGYKARKLQRSFAFQLIP